MTNEAELNAAKIAVGSPHGWVLVHLKDAAYVIETNSETGYLYVVGTVQEAAQGQSNTNKKKHGVWKKQKMDIKNY